MMEGNFGHGLVHKRRCGHAYSFRIGWAESGTVCGGLSLVSFRYRLFELRVCSEANMNGSY